MHALNPSAEYGFITGQYGTEWLYQHCINNVQWVILSAISFSQSSIAPTRRSMILSVSHRGTHVPIITLMITLIVSMNDGYYESDVEEQRIVVAGHLGC
jgi:hypothetical protein